MLNKEKSLCTEYIHLRAVEESFFMQKSCTNWLSLGDQNTGYFHRIVKIRNARNTIKFLYSTDGNMLTNPNEIASEAVSFYTNLIGTSDSNVSGGDLNRLKLLLSYRVSAEHKSFLTRPVTVEEVKSTLWSMANNSAPGPDGFNVHFYKTTWHIVGSDFTRAV